MIAQHIDIEYVYPSIPTRSYDYRATFGSYSGDPSDPMGYGPTAYDAIIDLLMQTED